jgi:hypothetical protein
MIFVGGHPGATAWQAVASLETRRCDDEKRRPV